MARTVIQDGGQDEALQELMNDIVKGVRVKMVEPVISESRKLAGLLGDLHSKDQQELAEIKARIDRLEEAVRATPVLLLAAIKEAINKAGVDGKP
ncbi:MAG: hypothetical protein ACYC4H_13360 [Desulfocucumaceae bacterium]